MRRCRFVVHLLSASRFRVVGSSMRRVYALDFDDAFQSWIRDSEFRIPNTARATPPPSSPPPVDRIDPIVLIFF